MRKEHGIFLRSTRKRPKRARKPVNPDRGAVCISVSKKEWGVFRTLCKQRKTTPSQRIKELVRQEIINEQGKNTGVDKSTTFW